MLAGFFGCVSGVSELQSRWWSDADTVLGTHRPAEALLMALAGRRGVTHEASGHGLRVLAARIGD